jgi:VanZ family protein
MKEHFLFRWLPVVLWAILIFITSANPNPYRPLPASLVIPTVSVNTNHEPKRINNDELGRFLHAAEYLVLAAFTARALVWRGNPSLMLLAMAFGLSALYALSDETHQLFVAGRAFQLSDLALDLGGAVIGVVAYAFLLIFWRRKKRSY